VLNAVAQETRFWAEEDVEDKLGAVDLADSISAAKKMREGMGNTIARIQ
jgi:hypothetical protein